MDQQLIDIRIREAGNKLACRHDPQANAIEVSIRGQRYTVNLDDYRRRAEPLTQNGRSDIILTTEGPR